jgi:hypothetical protein
MADQKLTHVDSLEIGQHLGLVLHRVLSPATDATDVLVRLSATNNVNTYVFEGTAIMNRNASFDVTDAVARVSLASALLALVPPPRGKVSYALEVLVPEGDHFVDYGGGVKGTLDLSEFDS